MHVCRVIEKAFMLETMTALPQMIDHCSADLTVKKEVVSYRRSDRYPKLLWNIIADSSEIDSETICVSLV